MKKTKQDCAVVVLSGDKFLTKKQVCATVARSATSLWRDVKQGRFPAPRQIGPLRIAWLASEVNAWMQSQPVVGSSK